MPSVLPGSPPTGGSNTPWGMVPQVPDPTVSAANAVTGDLANFPQLSQLANQTNLFNNQQSLAPYIAAMPGFMGNIARSSQNTSNDLAGIMGPDTINMLAQNAAERGVGGGFNSGSPNVSASLLRQEGLTSDMLRQRGAGELTQDISRLPVSPLFNTQSFMTTPGDEQAAQMQANIYAAAPNPNMQAQALLDLFNKFSSRFSGSGGTTIDRGLGGGGGTTSTGGGATTPGAGGGGGPVSAGGPGRSINSPAIFGQTGAGGLPGIQGPSAGGMPSIDFGGGGYGGWNPAIAGSGVLSPDMQSLHAGGSAQLSDPSSPSYQWWNQQDPYSALSGINWGAPTDFGSQPAVPDALAQSTSPAYDWQNQADPNAALSGINWAQPTYWNQQQGQGPVAPPPIAYDFLNPPPD